jgi:phosphoglycerate dehydrogenase-like enzyme
MPFTVINTSTYLTAEARSHLEKHGCRVRQLVLEKLAVGAFRREIRGMDAVIATGEYWDEKALDAAERLKIVARTGTGVDRIDLAAAAKLGIWVTNTPGAVGPAVADFTLGLILCLLRHIPLMVEEMKRGKWNKLCGKELGSLTLGIVGTGSIGKEVIKRARGFGAKILGYDVVKDEEFAAQWQVQYVPLDELLSRSDIVSLHCPLNEQTKGLLDRRRLKLMKKGAYLVNTSRAGVVEKQALIAALEAGQIAAAAIDVHDPAPLPPGDPLVALENVIVTPWTAYNTEEALSRMCVAAAADVVTVLQGSAPRFPVNRPENPRNA